MTSAKRSIKRFGLSSISAVVAALVTNYKDEISDDAVFNQLYDEVRTAAVTRDLAFLNFPVPRLVFPEQRQVDRISHRLVTSIARM